MNQDLKRKDILNDLFVELFNHILYIEEQNIQSKGIELTMNEVHTLDAISQEENPTMGNVARRLMITIGTLTTAIKKLESKGYVLRNKDEFDKRIVRLSLTSQSIDVLKIHEHFHDTMINDVLDLLNNNEQDALTNALNKIKEYFSR